MAGAKMAGAKQAGIGPPRGTPKGRGMALPLGLMLAPGLVLAAPAARAGTECAPRAHVLERLAGTYGESRRGMGLVSERGIVEIFASDATGTWTIVITLPSGQTCLIASGQDYRGLADPLPAAGKPA